MLSKRETILGECRKSNWHRKDKLEIGKLQNAEISE